ncbi:MAG: endonuclease domain-containing protein [Sphingomicrobium sp.]|nr:DUF559 domain-containing protein [Sphingomonadales bacterium]
MLRRTMTLPEVLLWQELRKRPGGLKFRRQQPAGPFVLDFYCEATRAAIEIDGMAHELGENPRRDTARDKWLHAHGIDVMRFRATDVLRSLDSVVESIVSTCKPLHHPAAPDGPPPFQGGST